ncbi:MAG: D-tyrosyl-tRNA(Tyr) deacylase [Alphaproteobacteria bacterium]|nr:D-tyrosyl-tRNA(Tyr) deacylase [Alphaproteobacteria bacterium]
MKLLIQRVKKASVNVNNDTVGKIEQGILIFIGVCKEDTKEQADFLARKAANLRIFEDENGKMNLSVKDIKGEALVISQFTLAGDCTRGNRPGFDKAAHPDIAKPMYEYFSEQLRNENIKVENGIFQADMQVSLINDGPVTFILEK